MVVQKRTKTPGAAEQLRSFIAKFSAKDQKLIRAVRAAMRKRLPTANELVWDNYNFLVIGYSPTERPSDSILSITARADSVAICFIHGATLPDPKGLLRGEGNQVRSIPVESAAVITTRDVDALIGAALTRAGAPMRREGKPALIIRSVSAKQRPRRRAK
jgi:hypothetical protein